VDGSPVTDIPTLSCVVVRGKIVDICGKKVPEGCKDSFAVWNASLKF
jgi:hypothetical protein